MLLSLGCYISRSKVYKPTTLQLQDSSTSTQSGPIYRYFPRGASTLFPRLLHPLLESLQAFQSTSSRTRQPRLDRAYSIGNFQGVPELLSVGCYIPRSKAYKLTNAPVSKLANLNQITLYSLREITRILSQDA